MSVLDQEGNPVSGLMAADFQATIHGRPAKILSVAADAQPRRIIVVLDASGSMREHWKTARAIAEAILASAQPDSEIGLVAFNNMAYVLAPLAKDRRAALDSLARIEQTPGPLLWGPTALYDAMLRSIHRLFPIARAGDAIFLVSDGEDNASRAKFEDVERELALAETRLDVLFLRGDIYGRRLEKRALKAISRLASVTGGEVAIVEPRKKSPKVHLEGESKGSADLPRVAAHFHAQLRVLYFVELEASEELKKQTELKLAQVKAAGPEKNSLRIIYPNVLLPCASRK